MRTYEKLVSVAGLAALVTLVLNTGGDRTRTVLTKVPAEPPPAPAPMQPGATCNTTDNATHMSVEDTCLHNMAYSVDGFRLILDPYENPVWAQFDDPWWDNTMLYGATYGAQSQWAKTVLIYHEDHTEVFTLNSAGTAYLHNAQPQLQVTCTGTPATCTMTDTRRGGTWSQTWAPPTSSPVWCNGASTYASPGPNQGQLFPYTNVLTLETEVVGGIQTLKQYLYDPTQGTLSTVNVWQGCSTLTACQSLTPTKQTKYTRGDPTGLPTEIDDYVNGVEVGKTTFTRKVFAEGHFGIEEITGETVARYEQSATTASDLVPVSQVSYEFGIYGSCASSTPNQCGYVVETAQPDQSSSQEYTTGTTVDWMGFPTSQGTATEATISFTNVYARLPGEQVTVSKQYAQSEGGPIPKQKMGQSVYVTAGNNPEYGYFDTNNCVLVKSTPDVALADWATVPATRYTYGGGPDQTRLTNVKTNLTLPTLTFSSDGSTTYTWDATQGVLLSVADAYTKKAYTYVPAGSTGAGNVLTETVTNPGGQTLTATTYAYGWQNSPLCGGGANGLAGVPQTPCAVSTTDSDGVATVQTTAMAVSGATTTWTRTQKVGGGPTLTIGTSTQDPYGNACVAPGCSTPAEGLVETDTFDLTARGWEAATTTTTLNGKTIDSHAVNSFTWSGGVPSGYVATETWNGGDPAVTKAETYDAVNRLSSRTETGGISSSATATTTLGYSPYSLPTTQIQSVTGAQSGSSYQLLTNNSTTLYPGSASTPASVTRSSSYTTPMGATLSVAPTTALTLTPPPAN